LELADELRQGRILTHPFVIGELACGSIHNRKQVLSLLARLASVPEVRHEEAMEFLERHELMRRGLGFVDVHLLASTALATPAKLWTRDRRLALVATELGLLRQS
jgi:predicted nucleic acid-binding protein